MIWKVVGRIEPRREKRNRHLPQRHLPHWLISLGPRRQLRCSCGNTYTHRPDEPEIPSTVATCDHFRALYQNGVPRYAAGDPLGMGHYRVHLTSLGHSMFDWRYSALALKNDT